jgi:hypothetical protein
MLLLLGFVLTGCGTEMQKVGDEIGKVINAAVPLKAAAFLPNALSWLGPIFDILSLTALISFVFLTIAVLFGPKTGQGSEVARGFVFIAGKVVLALVVFLADLFGRALWPVGLTTVGVITKLGWGWPLKADLDPATTLLAFTTLTFFPFWHVGVEILWMLYTLYGIVVGSVSRNTEPLQRAIIGWIFWVFSAIVWWFVVINGLGGVVGGGNFATSSFVHVNLVFIILTWLLMILCVSEPMRATLTSRVVPETMRVQAGGKLEELLGAFLAGYAGSKAAQQGGSPAGSGDTTIYGPDPQARPKLAPPREPKVASDDDNTSPSGFDPQDGADAAGTAPSGPTGPTSSSASPSSTQGARDGVRVSTRTARDSGGSSSSPSALPSALVGSNTPGADGSRVSATVSPTAVNARAAKEEDVTGSSSLVAATDDTSRVIIPSARRPREDEEDVQTRDAAVVQGKGSDAADYPAVSTRDAQAEERVLGARDISAEPPTPVLVDNGDDGRTLYYATDDVPDDLGMPLIPAGSMIVPDEAPNAVSDAGIVSYGKLIPWNRIRKVELREAENVA